MSVSFRPTRSAGLAERLNQLGLEHRGIYLQSPQERHRIDFVDLMGRRVWVYGQMELQKDLVAARAAAGQRIYYGASDVVLCDIATDRPSVTFTDSRVKRKGSTWTSSSAATALSDPAGLRYQSV